MQHSIGRPTSSGRIPPRRAAARGIARPGANDNVGGTPSRRRPQCRTAEQAIRRMSEEAPGDPGRHLVDALVSISPDRGRLPTDRRPTRPRKDSAVDVPLGCPLPAVLPAVSRSVRRFLTRSDPQSPSVFPTNAGFLGDFAEFGTGSKPASTTVLHARAAHPAPRPGPALAAAGRALLATPRPSINGWVGGLTDRGNGDRRVSDVRSFGTSHSRPAAASWPRMSSSARRPSSC